MINTKKTVQDILQEEMLRERAAVLARAGEYLTEEIYRIPLPKRLLPEKGEE
jgi:hypothetical protein